MFVRVRALVKFAVASCLSAGGLNISAAQKGSCDSAAESVTMKAVMNEWAVPTKAFSTVNWYDEYHGVTSPSNFVYCFKATLTRGRAYTVWAEDSEGNVLDIDAYPVESTSEEIFEPGASFGIVSGAWGTRAVLREDEWYIDEDDPEFSDPESWTYIFCIESDTPHVRGKFHFAQGMWVPLGIEENPLVIRPREGEGGDTTKEYSFVTNEFRFCCSAEFAYGRRYQFATHGGTEENPYSLAFGDGKVTPLAAWASDYNASFSYDPSRSGPGDIWIVEGSTNAAVASAAKFSLTYRLVPVRPIAQHDLVRPEPLTAGESVECRPGRINATDGKYYDLIFDDCLLKVSLVKGKRYVLDTVGAQANLLLFVYDARGNVLYESESDGTDTGNVRCAFVSPYTFDCYVGLAEKLADDDLDEPTRAPVTLRFDSVEPRNGTPDPWDAGDDTYAGAAPLNPVVGEDPLTDDPEGSDGWHRLDRTDWCDTFALSARAGCRYNLAVSLQDAEAFHGKLSAEVYRMDGRNRKKVKTSGDINPGSTGSLTFDTEEASGTYFISLTVSEGQGFDYPAYKIHAVGRDLAHEACGVLKVGIYGTSQGTWSLNAEKTAYRAGTSVIVPQEVAYAVKFSAVSGFLTPPVEQDVMVHDRDGRLVEGWYTDTFDPKDDRPSGRDVVDGKTVTYAATSLSLKNTAATWSRTFWGDDPADTYTFAGKDGQYYDFDFAAHGAVGGDEPDAVITITNDELGTLCENVDRVHQLHLPTTKAKYILTVSHRDPSSCQNTFYTLSGFFANVGAIKFSAAEYKVKDNAAEVKLTVNRTAKDGKVCVRLRTVDGENATGIWPNTPVTDDPKIKFYHLDETLVWANGDNKAKTVVIKLIPDRQPTFHDFARSFRVKMEDAFDGTADCYHASFATDSRTKKPLSETQVTFQESAKRNTGTVQVDDKAQNVKKPVFNVRAGGTLAFSLVRVDGDNGAITAKVDVAALTGVRNDFREVGWADGDVASKTVSVAIPPATDAKTSRKVTLKLSATSKDKPKFAASSITVSVYNDKFAATLADYAKTLPKTCGYTIKEGKSGTWVVDDNGDFVNMNTPSALTFTITGPALFSCKLDGVPTNVAVEVVGKTQTFVVPATVKEVTDVEYKFNFGKCETIYQAVRHGFGTPIAENGADVKAKVAVGKLPDGIKLEQDKATKAWYVRGVPTKAGFYYAEIQDTASRPASSLTNLAFEVVALRSAIGTFNGLVKADDESKGCSTNRLQSLAQVTLTTAVSGKLSAKVALAGKTYSFTSTGFVSAKPIDSEDGDSKVMLGAELIQIQKIKTRAFTNTLHVALVDLEENDPEAWGARATLELGMAALPDLKGSGFQEAVSYKGRAYRDNSKVADWALAASRFAGYYTMALVPMDDFAFELGEPCGNGYLTMTVDAKGKVKLTGVLANGTSYSASSLVGNLDGGDNDGNGGLDEEPAVTVPIYSFKSTTLFGGWLTVRFPAEGEPVITIRRDPVAGDDDIRWISEDAAGAYSGYGFDIRIAPAGGYYDTVVSLQRYYLGSMFAIEFPSDDSLDILRNILKSTYGETYDFVAAANPAGMDVSVIGDTVSAPKQALVKEMDGTKKTSFNDWASCINAANVKLTFKRATGVLTGTCDLWYEGTNGTKRVQNAFKNCKHAGVLIMNREKDGTVESRLPDDVWTAGAVVIPQSFRGADGKTRKWNASFPFNIKAEEFN